MSASQSGIVHGHLCPCGKGATETCALCGRGLCVWHNAGQVREVGTMAVCFPACESQHWIRLAAGEAREWRPK
jgi:hypothetical protein